MDAYMRSVNDSTILVPVMDPAIKDKNSLLRAEYEATLKNLKQIRSERNVDGKLFNIVEIPYPDISLYAETFELPERYAQSYTQTEVGDTVTYVPIMGYSNFLITNDVVLVAEYWKEGLPISEKENDNRMKDILREYFPDREVIGIKNILMTNWYGGGIHCQTMQIPAIN